MDFVNAYIADRSNLAIDKDIQRAYKVKPTSIPFLNFKSCTIQKGSDVLEIDKYFKKNQNTTQIGLVYCVDGFFILKEEYRVNCSLVFGLNSSFGYLIVLNNSQIPITAQVDPLTALNIHPVATPLKVLVDNALTFYAKSNFTFSNQTSLIPDEDIFEFSHQHFPHPKNKLNQNYDLVTQEGASFFILPVMLVFLVFVHEILEEKEKLLRKGLNVIGMSSSVYWVSWVIFCFIISAFVSGLILLNGYVFQFDFFINNSCFYVTFLLFFVTILGVYSMALIICSLATTTHQGAIAAYSLVVFSIIVELLIANPTMTSILYFSGSTPAIEILRSLLWIYPPFSYSLIFGDISSNAGYSFDLSELEWLKGYGYHWNNFTTPRQMKVSDKLAYEIPSSFFAFCCLVGSTLILFVVFLYLDNLVPSNRGYGKPWHFFLSDPVKWLCSKRKKVIKGTRDSAEDFRFGGTDDPVEAEKMKVQERMRENAFCSGVRISCVEKIYGQKGKMCRKNKKEIKALDSVSLEMKEGELVAILGHNGAGIFLCSF